MTKMMTTHLFSKLVSIISCNRELGRHLALNLTGQIPMVRVEITIGVDAPRYWILFRSPHVLLVSRRVHQPTWNHQLNV